MEEKKTTRVAVWTPDQVSNIGLGVRRNLTQRTTYRESSPRLPGDLTLMIDVGVIMAPLCVSSPLFSFFFSSHRPSSCVVRCGEGARLLAGGGGGGLLLAVRKPIFVTFG